MPRRTRIRMVGKWAEARERKERAEDLALLRRELRREWRETREGALGTSERTLCAEWRSAPSLAKGN